MRTRLVSILIGLSIAFLTPLPASAYLTPEEVLYNAELYLPPSPGSAQDRVARQQEESEIRRSAEQEIIFGAQHPPEPEVEEEEETHESADEDISATELDLIRTLRLLQRVDDDQRFLRYAAALHGGAPRPDLAPTGPGAILSALSMIGAVGFTLYRSRRKVS